MTTPRRRVTDVPAPRPALERFLDFLWSIYVAITIAALTLYGLMAAVPSRSPLALALLVLAALVAGHFTLWFVQRGADR